MPDVSRASRMRLNWFSPLRPSNTAIAHYAIHAVRALSRQADVAVWAERADWPRELDSYALVRQWDGASWGALNAADATLYHMGNNVVFHGWIWDVARRHPGIIVLHDTRLHDFFWATLFEMTGTPEAYRDAVRRLHGDGAVALADRMLRDEIPIHALAEPIPLTALALERARGAVVHSSFGFDQVTAFELCPVLQVDLPYAPGSPLPTRSWDGVLKMVVFGYLGGNRRLEVILDAIATFPERARLRLDILGRHQHPAELADHINALDLADIVRLRGFVAEAELNETLDHAHLALNLRFPTMGEASESQLRIWSRGLASLVTRTGWYGELPADAVWFVDPANEIAELHAHFVAALAQPDALQAMGQAGRRLLESRHDPARYAEELVEGVQRMMRTPVSIIGEAIRAMGRIAHEGGIHGPARTAIARRVADELCRWIVPQAGD